MWTSKTRSHYCKPLGITVVISNHPNTFPPISTSKYLSAFIRPIQVSNRTERLKPHTAAPNTPFAMDDPLTAHWAPLVNRASFTGRDAEARPVIVLYNLSGSFQVISTRVSLAGLSELRNGVKFGNRHNFNKYQQGVSSSQLVNPLVNQIIEYLIHGLEFNKSNPTSTIEQWVHLLPNPCWIPQYKPIMSWFFVPRWKVTSQMT